MLVHSRIFRKETAIIAMMILAAMIVTMPASGDEKQFTPWDFNKTAIKEKTAALRETTTPLSGALLIMAVRFYQNHLSPVIGNRCPMYPSCSAYSIEAIKKHGFFMGLIMTSDRLIHESNEMDAAPMIKINDEYRYFDPAQNNDFWWFKPK